MHKYYFATEGVDWSAWENDMDAAFARVVAATPEKRMIGFKLIYQDVHEENMVKFLDFAARREITIIHLVRESALNKLASVGFLPKQKLYHSTNATEVEELKHTAAITMPLQFAVDKIVELDREHENWSRHIRLTPGLFSMKVVYEQVMSAPMLERTMQIINPGLSKGTISWVKNEDESALKQLHLPRCDAHIANTAEIMAELHDSPTPLACDLLSRLG